MSATMRAVRSGACRVPARNAHEFVDGRVQVARRAGRYRKRARSASGRCDAAGTDSMPIDRACRASGSNCTGVVVGSMNGPPPCRGRGSRCRSCRRVDLAMVEVDRAVVMPRMAGRIDELERASPEPEPHAVVGDRHDTVGGNRQQLAVELADTSPRHRPRSSRRSASTGRQVRRTARVQHRLRVRQCLHQLAGAARVIEVHVGQDHVLDLVACDAEFVEGAAAAAAPRAPGRCRRTPHGPVDDEMTAPRVRGARTACRSGARHRLVRVSRARLRSTLVPVESSVRGHESWCRWRICEPPRVGQRSRKQEGRSRYRPLS